MKRTSLYDCHVSLGATMVPFAGWDMPVSYDSTIKEVEAVHANAGIFDVSHMGVLHFTGADAFEFLQYIAANDLNRIKPGLAQYSLLLKPDGTVVDDIIIYQIAPNDYRMIVNAGCKDKDWEWINTQAQAIVASSSGSPRSYMVDIVDESDHTDLIAVQGPDAVNIVAKLAGDNNLIKTERFSHMQATIAGKVVTAARTGYTGEDGFEIMCDSDDAVTLWNALVGAGVKPAGLGARDVLRLEAAYPLYGHELSEDVNAVECGVGWAIRTAKADFIGKDAIINYKKNIKNKLVGLKIKERGIPRENYNVLETGGTTVIGIVTSGTFSPTIKAGIAMARINTAYCKTGEEVIIDIRGRHTAAIVVDLPFYRNGV